MRSSLFSLLVLLRLANSSPLYSLASLSGSMYAVGALLVMLSVTIRSALFLCGEVLLHCSEGIKCGCFTHDVAEVLDDVEGCL